VGGVDLAGRGEHGVRVLAPGLVYALSRWHEVIGVQGHARVSLLHAVVHGALQQHHRQHRENVVEQQPHRQHVGEVRQQPS